MSKYCILNSSNVVVNIITAENPVPAATASLYISTWESARSAWIAGGKIGPEPPLPVFWTIPEGLSLGSEPSNWETCKIGSTWSGTEYIPPPDPVEEIRVPNTISDRQFFQGLAILGKITQQEALDAVKTGEIPAAMNSFLNLLDPSAQFSAKMNLSGATQFNRDHELVSAFGQFMSMTEQELDDLWIFCSTL